MCEAGRCRAWVLMKQVTRDVVVDCESGNYEPLLGKAGSTGIATRSRDSLFTFDGERVVQRTRVEPDLIGWLPLWPVAEQHSDALASIDTTEDSDALLLFSTGGSVEVLNPTS